jgi:hypothetical protein
MWKERHQLIKIWIISSDRTKKREVLRNRKFLGRQGTSEGNVEHIRESCIRRSKMSIARRGLEIAIPNSTVQNVIHNCSRRCFYTIQQKHKIKHDDRPKCLHIASWMLMKVYYVRFVSQASRLFIWTGFLQTLYYFSMTFAFRKNFWVPSADVYKVWGTVQGFVWPRGSAWDRYVRLECFVYSKLNFARLEQTSSEESDMQICSASSNIISNQFLTLLISWQ